jgi:methylmalonyl-CoA mutase N-terminal domain/subunit
MGGSVTAIEQGFIQNEIARSAYEYQRQIENKEKIIVGVNRFTIDEKNKIPLLKIDDAIREMQAKRLQALKAKRNNEQVQNSLCKIETAAKEGTNLMPVVIEAVENFCTLGEIADTLRKVFGEYR